jgi:putative CocE/NonD family hydrolase
LTGAAGPHIRREFPRTSETRDEWIELSDGTRLFARIVLPVDAGEDPVPALLEYLPYRIVDGTALRDARHHPWYAGHGYASVRVDQRGSGNSEGLLLDEYLPQEQLDAAEVIAWLAEQPWCTGAVGMFGISWGGFNGLQVAARRPPALKAVISLCSTDDRYADDVHCMGGCVLGAEVLTWPSFMLGSNALPPDPEYVGEGWRGLWQARLEGTPPFLETWLTHQRRDDFWKQGSICEDYGAVTCPVYMIGGWADGYTNAIPRTLAGLSGAGTPCKGLIGPWAHGYPELATPGPQIGYLQESLRWWDHWLKGEQTGIMDEPVLRAWMQDPVTPSTSYLERPGRWVAEASWPSPRIVTQRLWLTGRAGLSERPGPPQLVETRGHEGAGADAGHWCPYGAPADFPGDQRVEDALAACFTSAPLEARLEILGNPVVELELASDRPQALVAVRLTDVAPDGSSLLVSRGLLNLSHRESHETVSTLVPGERVRVRVVLDVAGHGFDPGHRLRLAVSPTYWPFAWPSPEIVTLGVSVGNASSLELPVRPPSADDVQLAPFAEPEIAPPLAADDEPSRARRSVRDLASGSWRLEQDVVEWTRLRASGLAFGERGSDAFTIVEGDPLSARIDRRYRHELQRGSWRVACETRTSLSATATDFIVRTELEVFDGDERVHRLERTISIPRDGV